MEEVDKDNSELLDAGAATQQLSTDDIAALRAAGKTGQLYGHITWCLLAFLLCVPTSCSLAGEEIVAALAEGSATFQGKTHFSQAKYKKKKHKKYTVMATVQRPTARSVCEVCLHFLSRHQYPFPFIDNMLSLKPPVVEHPCVIPAKGHVAV